MNDRNPPPPERDPNTTTVCAPRPRPGRSHPSGQRNANASAPLPRRAASTHARRHAVHAAPAALTHPGNATQTPARRSRDARRPHMHVAMLRMRGRRDRSNWDPRARPPPPTSIDGWLESLEGRERRARVTATTYGQPTADARAHVKRPRPAGGRAGAGGDTPTRAHQWTTTCRGHGLLPLPAGHTTAAAMHFPWTTHASFVQSQPRRSGAVLVRCRHACSRGPEGVEAPACLLCLGRRLSPFVPSRRGVACGLPDPGSGRPGGPWRGAMRIAHMVR
jgi:hypothetical protein